MYRKLTVLLVVASWGFTVGPAQALTPIGTDARLDNTTPEDLYSCLPNIAYGDGVYAVVYAEAAALNQWATQVWVAFVDPATGAFLSRYRLSTGSYTVATIYGGADIAYNPVDQEFGVAWYGNAGTDDIYFRPIKKDGTSRIPELNLTNHQRPQSPIGIEWDSVAGRYAMLIGDWYPDIWKVRLITFNRDGGNKVESATLGDREIAGAAGAAMAVGPGGYGIVYGGYSAPGVCFMYLDRNMNIVTPLVLVSTDAVANLNMTYGDGKFGVEWVLATPYRLVFEHVDTSGVGGTPKILANNNTNLYGPHIQWDGTRFITIWNDARDGTNFFIYGMTHDKNGVSATGEVRIPQLALPPRNFDVTFKAPGEYCVAWEQHVGAGIYAISAVEDAVPPGPVTGFTATAGEAQTTLAWTNPSTADFTATMIRYKTTGYPASPTDGTLVVNKANTPGSNDSYVHTGLTYGLTYYYAAFAHDLSNNYSSAVTAHASPLDTTPPGPVTSFTATPSNGRVTLAWVNPSDADFKGTRIRYKTTGFPTSPTNGILLADLANTPGSHAQYVHNGLTNGVTYYYAAFAHDGVPNYAVAATASGKPFIPGDFDLDGDVDQQDFGHFQVCLSGFGTPYAAGCADADLEGDNDVDTNDLSVFLDCMAGANQPPRC